MRWEPAAIIGLFALACATACGGGGGSDNVTITTQTSFPQGLLPVPFANSFGSGDVTLKIDGDLFAVDGRTADVTTVSRTTGAVSTFADDVGGASNALSSITVGFGDDARLFAGDEAGRIWAIATDGVATLFVDTGTGQPITGLAFSQSTFGSFGAQLFAAAGTAGVLRVAMVAPVQAVPFSNPTGEYGDIGFTASTLFALDVANAEIDKVEADGTATSFQGGFDTPVGMAVDNSASEIYVADAGDGVLYTVPVAGGAPTARAAYSFDPDAPSGIAHDGLAALAFITTDPPAIRGSVLPRIAANATFGQPFVGPTVGYGDLELDRTGAFVIAANDDDDPQVSGDSTNNFLFSASRDLSFVTVLAPTVGSPVEELLGVAVDPVEQVIYFSTRRGNVYRRASDGSGTGAPFMSLTSNVPVMGIELVPASFGAGVGEDLIATTAAGEVRAIHSQAQTHRLIATITTTSGQPAPLSDLVFATDGTLYVLDNAQSVPPGDPRILIVGSSGSVAPLAVDPDQLGRPDGIEIDEGGNRLLVASETAAGGQLLSVDLRPARLGEVRALANFAIDNGFFPTGLVYDRLGTAVVRQGNNSTSLHAVSVPLPVP